MSQILVISFSTLFGAEQILWHPCQYSEIHSLWTTIYLAHVGRLCVHYAVPVDIPGSPRGYRPFMYPWLFHAQSFPQFSQSSKLLVDSSLLMVHIRPQTRELPVKRTEQAYMLCVGVSVMVVRG